MCAATPCCSRWSVNEGTRTLSTHILRSIFTSLFQWPNLPPQPYPLAPYGGTVAYANVSSHTRSVPSGRAKRGNSSARGRGQGSRKDETPALDSTSQPARSVPRSGRAATLKPYAQGRELKTFNDIVWDSARRWFVLRVWSEGCFFIKADGQEDTVDRCASDAYEDAITEYRDTQPGGAALITKYRSERGPDALIVSRPLVSVVITISVVLPFPIHSSCSLPHPCTSKLLWTSLVQRWLRNMPSKTLSLQEDRKTSKKSSKEYSVKMASTTPP